jgi:CheY-like chemotaxis protein
MKKAHGRGTLTIKTKRKDGLIYISFKDDGMGISAEIKPKLFNPFFTTKSPGEGTGLGLSLSRAIILEHGGTMEVESEPGQGANFIIMLPVAKPAKEMPAETEAYSALAGGQTKPARILLVEDEEPIRNLVSKILVQRGHSIDTTGNPGEALAKLETDNYDVIITDVRMPGMSGMEFYSRVAENSPELAGKFIFLTGDVSDFSTQDFLERNGLPYISKPFTMEVLLQKVESLL